MPHNNRYPEDYEDTQKGRQTRIYSIANYVDAMAGLGTAEAWDTNIFTKKGTCTVLECFWAHRTRNPTASMNMEAFLEMYDCAHSWTTDPAAAKRGGRYNTWLSEPDESFRACYFDVRPRAGSARGLGEITRISRDNDQYHDPSWCLHHFLLVPKPWNFVDV